MKSMRTFFYGTLLGLTLICGMTSGAPATANPSPLVNLPIGIVNFKLCVEKSRLGRQEQTNFDKLKHQMDNALQESQKGLIEKQKVYQETKAKWDDLDYRDSLKPEAEAELKHKLRSLEQDLSGQGQELAQHEEQCYQILNQTNVKAVQKLHELLEKASEIVAKQEGLLMMVNQEAFFYYSPQLDKTDLVLAQLDKLSEPELRRQQQAASQGQPAPKSTANP